MPTRAQLRRAKRLEAECLALQRRAGAAVVQTGADPKPEDPGTVVTGEVIRSYLNRVDGGYKTLDAAANTAFNEAHATKYLPTASAYIVEWWPAFKRWRTFYEEAIDDWVPSGSTYSETRNYHIELADFHRRFKAAMGKDPPPIPGIAEVDPSTSMLGQITTLVKWGLLAYVVVSFGTGFLKGASGK